MSHNPQPSKWRSKLKAESQRLGSFASFRRRSPQPANAGPMNSVPSTPPASDVGNLISESVNPNSADAHSAISIPASLPRSSSPLTAPASTSVFTIDPSSAAPTTPPPGLPPTVAGQTPNGGAASSAPDHANPLSSIQPAPSTTPRSLWSEASEKLSIEERETILKLLPASAAKSSFSKPEIDKLLGLTQDVEKECEDNSFKFHFHGKEIILKDVAGKIIYWLNKFKDVGDIAVNFDPIHASLPWAGIRFLLEAAIGEHEQMGNLVITIDKLSYLIHRGAIYEKLYPPEISSTDVDDNLHGAMIGLYATILRSIALCHRLFTRSTTKRAMHALFNPGHVSEILKECDKLEQRVEYEAHNCERTRSQEADAEAKKLLGMLEEPVLRTDERVFKLLERTEERDRLDILDWVSKVLYGSNHQRVTDSRATGTCEWLVTHKSYQEWQSESASIILWLYGNPGTGKTFLTSKVIDNIRGKLQSRPNQEGFAFFYCNRNEAERREPLSVLRAFVRQLSTTVTDSLFMQKSLKQFCSETRLKACQPTVSDCKKILLELVNIYPRTTLVLDALDECDARNRLELIEVFDYLLAEASNPLKIFISSRPELDIRKKLSGRTNIEIQAKDNYHDITKFVKSRILEHSRWDSLSSALQKKTVTTLQDKSQGMFQWAFLQIEQLLDLDLEEDILDRLGKLPEDLKQAYDEIYNAMKPHEKRIASRAFRWVLCACAPLTTSQLLPAVCQDEKRDDLKSLGGLDEDLLLKYCHNLLVIDPVRKVWVPSHLSVIEYFETHLWTQSEASCLVASTCLLLLKNTVIYGREQEWAGSETKMRKDSSSETKIEVQDPLHEQGFEHFSLYARHHWMIHVQNSAEVGDKTRISVLLEEFLGLPTDSSPSYRCWHRMVSADGNYQEKPSTSIFDWFHAPSHLAPASISSFSFCAFGLATILPIWQNNNWVKEDARTQRKSTFLELTAEYGSISGCRHLISHGAEVNALTESAYGSALAAAAGRGEKEIVEFLVQEEGAEVNMQLRNIYYGNALAAATLNGKEEVVEFLVKEGGAEVNMQLQNGYHGSALAAAAYQGRSEIVRFLVNEGGAKVNMQLQYGRFGSVLVAAACGGNKEIVKFLVKEGGAKVNLQLQYGQFGTALDAAENSVFRSGRESAQLLIEYGAVRGMHRNKIVGERSDEVKGENEDTNTDFIAEEQREESDEIESESEDAKADLPVIERVLELA